MLLGGKLYFLISKILFLIKISLTFLLVEVLKRSDVKKNGV